METSQFPTLLLRLGLCERRARVVVVWHAKQLTVVDLLLLVCDLDAIHDLPGRAKQVQGGVEGGMLFQHVLNRDGVRVHLIERQRRRLGRRWPCRLAALHHLTICRHVHRLALSDRFALSDRLPRVAHALE